MSAVVETSKVDITGCDIEPIHMLGLIQPHGWLCACRTGSRIVSYVSGNAAAACGVQNGSLLDSDLAEIIGRAAFEEISQTAISSAKDHLLPCRCFAVTLNCSPKKWDVTVHSFNQFVIYEFEPAAAAATATPLDLARNVLQQLQQAKTLRDLCDRTSVLVRELTGFDRVMIYRFLDDGAGQVIAESRTPELESLLNLRYPASDIPRQARELYKKSWIRLICDVVARPCSIEATSELSGQPLDLSFSTLRSVSPVHIEYLRNMKVGASMSISIIVGGELWGLIACHHAREKFVPSGVRAATELLGQVFSLQIQTVEGVEAYVTMRAARSLLDRIVAEFPVGGDLIDNLAQRLESLSAFINSDGAGIWVDGIWRSIGISPAMTEIAALATFTSARRPSEVYWTQNLGNVYDRARRWPENICGVMAIPLSRTNGDALFFFRKEVTQTIDWAGNPEKPVLQLPNTTQLSPRHSFAAWRECVQGQSLPWTSRERLIADTLRLYLLDIIVRLSDVILDERYKSRQRTDALKNELNARVKGTLELIRSLVSSGAKEGSITRYVRSLEGRIGTIAMAHEVISAAHGAQMRNLFEICLGANAKSDQVELSGPDIELDSKAFTVVALVVHELADNAAKFGALSTPQGHLAIQWSKDVNGNVLIAWEELSNPSDLCEGPEGLGLKIIKHNIPHTLNGRADVLLSTKGLSARFVVPGLHVITPIEPVPASSFHLPSPEAQRLLDGLALLVLDDQLLSATDLRTEFMKYGATSVEIAGTVSKALESLAEAAPDAVVLDFDLDGQTSLAVAERLDDNGIPFVFVATELERRAIPARFHDVPVVGKTTPAEDIAHQLRGALMPGLIRAVLADLV